MSLILRVCSDLGCAKTLNGQIYARWTRSSEELTRRFGPRDHRPENVPCASQIGHMKIKNAWVMKTTWTKEEEDGVMALGGVRAHIYIARVHG